MKIKTLTICCSASFYNQALEIKEKLEKMGFQVKVPLGATRLKEDKGFNPEAHKSSYIEKEDWHIKAELIKIHFKKILEADAIVVVNFEKHDTLGYIGGNTLMEMALAFHYKKPIYILSPVSKESSFYEEIMGMQPIFLNGDLNKI